MITLMTRPKQPTKQSKVVQAVTPVEPTFTACGKCVSRKMCQEKGSCLHGAKSKRKKKNG